MADRDPRRGARVRVQVVGGRFERNEFVFCWPIWQEPARLAVIRVRFGPSRHRREQAARSGIAHLRYCRMFAGRAGSGSAKFMSHPGRSYRHKSLSEDDDKDRGGIGTRKGACELREPSISE